MGVQSYISPYLTHFSLDLPSLLGLPAFHDVFVLGDVLRQQAHQNLNAESESMRQRLVQVEQLCLGREPRRDLCDLSCLYIY